MAQHAQRRRSGLTARTVVIPALDPISRHSAEGTAREVNPVPAHLAEVEGDCWVRVTEEQQAQEVVLRAAAVGHLIRSAAPAAERREEATPAPQAPASMAEAQFLGAPEAAAAAVSPRRHWPWREATEVACRARPQRRAARRARMVPLALRLPVSIPAEAPVVVAAALRAVTAAPAEAVLSVAAAAAGAPVKMELETPEPAETAATANALRSRRTNS